MKDKITNLSSFASSLLVRFSIFYVLFLFSPFFLFFLFSTSLHCFCYWRIKLLRNNNNNSRQGPWCEVKWSLYTTILEMKINSKLYHLYNIYFVASSYMYTAHIHSLFHSYTHTLTYSLLHLPYNLNDPLN